MAKVKCPKPKAAPEEAGARGVPLGVLAGYATVALILVSLLTHIELPRWVLTAAHDLPPHALLAGAGDLAWDCRVPPPGALTDAAEAAGGITRGSIRAGSVVTGSGLLRLTQAQLSRLATAAPTPADAAPAAATAPAPLPPPTRPVEGCPPGRLFASPSPATPGGSPASATPGATAPASTPTATPGLSAAQVLDGWLLLTVPVSDTVAFQPGAITALLGITGEETRLTYDAALVLQVEASGVLVALPPAEALEATGYLGPGKRLVAVPPLSR